MPLVALAFAVLAALLLGGVVLLGVRKLIDTGDSRRMRSSMRHAGERLSALSESARALYGPHREDVPPDVMTEIDAVADEFFGMASAEVRRLSVLSGWLHWGGLACMITGTMLAIFALLRR